MKKPALIATVLTAVALALATIHISRTQQGELAPQAETVAVEKEDSGDSLQKEFIARHAKDKIVPEGSAVSKPKPKPTKKNKPARLSFQKQKDQRTGRLQKGLADMGLQPRSPSSGQGETSLQKVAEHMSKKPHFDDPMKDRWVQTGKNKISAGKESQRECDIHNNPTPACVRGQENEISVVGVVLETGSKKHQTFEKFSGEVQQGSYYEAKPVFYAE